MRAKGKSVKVRPLEDPGMSGAQSRMVEGRGFLGNYLLAMAA